MEKEKSLSESSAAEMKKKRKKKYQYCQDDVSGAEQQYIFPCYGGKQDCVTSVCFTSAPAGLKGCKLLHR